MERLHFDDLNRHLMLKNGNYLYKVPFRGGNAVLKVYYGSRGPVETLLKTLDNVLLAGQTSFMPKARLRNEQTAMAIWKDAGIRVFEIYRDVTVDGLPEGGYALYEYVPGVNFHKLLGNDRYPLEERLSLYREFLRQWYKRHRLAVDRSEPRLIHENGDLKHVMVHEGKLYWFDFEMCFRSGRHVEDLVARELMAYIKSLRQFVKNDSLFDLFFDETVRGYEGKEFLEAVYPVFFRNRNVLTRLARNADYRLRAKQRRPGSKYSLAIRVRDRMAR
jgi:hypothetical protein